MQPTTAKQAATRLADEAIAALQAGDPSALIAFHRDTFGGYRMDGDEGDDENDPPGGGGGDENATVEIDGKTHKIADLKRIMADEKRQGKRSGERSLLEQLGFDDPAKAKAFIDRAREDEKARESDVERREREATERQEKAEQREREANERVRTASLRSALVERGVSREDLDDAVVLLDRDVADDADDDAIGEAADKLKERREALFGGSGDTRRPPAGRGPAGGTGTRPQPKGAQWGAAGLDRAKRRGFIKTST